MYSMSSRTRALIVCLSVAVSATAAAKDDQQPDIRVRADEKAAALVAQLTLDEKLDQAVAQAALGMAHVKASRASPRFARDRTDDASRASEGRRARRSQPA